MDEHTNKVVLCKDCEHSTVAFEADDGDKHIVCKIHNWWVNSGHFCADGTRKESD